MSKRILLVEDQEDDRQIIRDMLAATDYEITEAEDGEQALAAVAKEPPDLILMEIQLPSMDGYEAMRRIRTNPSLISIPIIASPATRRAGKNRRHGQLAVTTLCSSHTVHTYCWRKFGSTYVNSSRSIAALHMSPYGRFCCRSQR